MSPSQALTLVLLSLVSTAGCRLEPADQHTAGTQGTTQTIEADFIPHGFGISRVRFAIDARGFAQPYTSLETGQAAHQPIEIELVVFDEQAASHGLDPPYACSLIWELEDPLPPAPWAAEVGLWASFDLPDTPPTENTCAARTFPSAWGKDPTSQITKWAWGFGVGPLTAAMEPVVEDSLGEQFDALEPYLAGGGFLFEGGADKTQPGWRDAAVTFVYRADDSLTQVMDGDYAVLEPAAGLAPEGELIPAIFDVQTIKLITPADALLARP